MLKESRQGKPSSLFFRREQTLIPQAANSQSVPDGLMACINSIDCQH